MSEEKQEKKSWTSSAGPRQTKQVNEALRSLNTRGKTCRELSGIIGGEEHSWSFVNVFGGVSKACAEAWKRLGDKWDWTITRENFKQIIAEAEAEALAMEIPVIDKRRTAEEDTAQKTEMAAREAEREAAAAAKASEKEKIVAELRTQYPWAGKNDGLSTHARAAKNLRTELGRAFPGTTFRVTSSSYSGGNSIDVAWTNGPTSEQVKKITGKYTCGSFDGMTDSYDYDRSAAGDAVDEVLGRVRHLFENREASPELAAKGRELILAEYGIEDDPSKQPWEIYLDEAKSRNNTLARKWGEAFEQQTVPKGASLIGLCEADDVMGFMLTFLEPDISDETGKLASGAKCHVEKHLHTKKGFEFWIVVLDDRVERAEFERVREDCKAAGGWYSRQWGKTPGGFAFEEEAAANDFADSLNAAEVMATA